MAETTYELRKLCSKDMFPMFNIIRKIGVKEFKACFESEEVKKMIQSDGKKNLNSIGIAIITDVIGIILDHVSDCEKDIYKFLSGISGLKETDVTELPLDEFARMVVAVVKKDEFKDFIQVVSELFK